MQHIGFSSTSVKFNRSPSTISTLTSQKMYEANWNQLEAERLVGEGSMEAATAIFEKSKTLYAQLIYSDEPFEVQLEAYKQWVKLATTESIFISSGNQVNRVVREYKIKKLSAKLLSSLGLNPKLEQGIERSATKVEQQIKINVELADFYRQEALKIERTGKPKIVLTFRDILYSTKVDSINNTTQEYNEAACISHLEMASQLGDAESTFALAKIFKENQYFLPYDNPKKKTNDDIAVFYGALAERQGRLGTAGELAELYAQGSSSKEREKIINNCYLMGIKCADERARKKMLST